jgi:hypothetical protein
MSIQSFPTRADQIDGRWLTHVLREHGGLGAGKVSGFAIEPVAEPGQTADMCRIVLEYEGGAIDAPRSLVAKFPASFGPARELARQYESYLVEVSFYQKLARGRDLPVPKAYAAEIDRETGDFVLLLEDLSSARNGTLFGSSVADVEIGLAHLARIHGAFWDDPLLDQHAFVRNVNEPTWNAMLKGVTSQIVPAARAYYADQFSQYGLSAMETWLAVWDDFVGYEPDPQTLVHVDAHPKQMFFPTAQLPRFALFDWQAVAKNWSAYDVARLLVTGLSVEARRTHEHRLVDGYYAALCRHGASGLSKERLWFQIKVAHVNNIYINLIAVLQTDVAIFEAAARAEGADWRTCLLGRVGAAIDDWKVGDALKAFAGEARIARAR